MADNHYHDDPDDIHKPQTPRKLPKVLAFIAFVVCGGLFLQNTLASNINLNTAGTSEFGQGFSQTVACSGGTPLTVTPASSFTNISGAGTYYLTSVAVSNIPSNCYGSDLTIIAYGDSSSTPLALFNSTSTNAVVYNNSGTFQIGVGGTGATVTSGSGTFTVAFASPVATSNTIKKLTLQSGSHTKVCAEGGTCNLGDTGSGGGVVFLLNSASGGLGGAYTYEAWQADLSSSVMNWNNVSGVLGTGNAIGDGYTNRLLFGGGAGLGCKNATYSGLTDWFLPNNNELQQLRNYWVSSGKTQPPAMKDTGYGYWTSSENGASYGVAVRWNDGMNYGDSYASKTSPVNTGWVRCVRRF